MVLHLPTTQYWDFFLVGKHIYQSPKEHLQKRVPRQKLETAKDGRLTCGETYNAYRTKVSWPKREDTSRLKNICSKLSRFISSFYHLKSLLVIKRKEMLPEVHQQILAKERMW